MKKNRKSAMRLIMAIGFVLIMTTSCDNDVLEMESSPKVETSKSLKISTTTQQRIKLVLKHHPEYKKEDIGISNEYLIAGSCGLYPNNDSIMRYFPQENNKKEGLSARYDVHPERVTQTKTITLVDRGLTNGWSEALIDATNAWNNLDGSLSFSVICSNSHQYGSVNISMSNLIEKFSGEDSERIKKIIGATSFIKNDGYPSEVMFINSAYVNKDTQTHLQKVYTMVHEIGHTIGIADIKNSQNAKGVYQLMLGGKCDMDGAESVMQQGDYNWKGFSDCDKKAYLKIYPKLINPGIIGLPGSGATGGRVKILYNQLNVRNQPWGSYVAIAYKNQTYDIIGSKKDNNGATWYKININGKVGYVHGGSQYVKVIGGGTGDTGDTGSTQRVKILYNQLNVRNQPWGSYVAIAYKNQTYDIIGSKKDNNGATWYKININGKIGYVHGGSQYVKVI